MQHNPLCPLCQVEQEDGCHLLFNRSYTREVLSLIWNWLHLGGTPSTCSQDQEPVEWLASNAAKAGGMSLQGSTGKILSCWWNIWEERNKHIFEGVQRSAFQVASTTKDEIELFEKTFSA
jgi:hypothetical protein